MLNFPIIIYSFLQETAKIVLKNNIIRLFFILNAGSFQFNQLFNNFAIALKYRIYVWRYDEHDGKT
tara:strand:- start:14059 stop:14256 length:198 start_codon:yes stop_codon:yes gene_type:complete